MILSELHVLAFGEENKFTLRFSPLSAAISASFAVRIDVLLSSVAGVDDRHFSFPITFFTKLIGVIEVLTLFERRRGEGVESFSLLRLLFFSAIGEAVLTSALLMMTLVFVHFECFGLNFLPGTKVLQFEH